MFVFVSIYPNIPISTHESVPFKQSIWLGSTIAGLFAKYSKCGRC